MFIRLVNAVLTAVFFGYLIQTTTSADPLLDDVSAPWFGDYSAMKKERIIRALIPFSITNYYINNGQEKGFSVEYMREFEKFLNRDVKREIDKLRIVLIPTQRDRLIPNLAAGRGDIAVANLTITPSRLEMVDFSEPLSSVVRELLITRDNIPDLVAQEDLYGMDIHVRKSSSYAESLKDINNFNKKGGIPQINIHFADENLEDEELLEMVQSGMLPAVVADEHIAKPWLKYFTSLKAHTGYAIASDRKIAWAFRKKSPELEAVVNKFIEKNRIGTMFGNIIAKRYYSDANTLVNPKADKYQERLSSIIDIFRKYGEKYKIDPMLLAAQAFQESKFNNEAKSRVGAVGIMQVLPSTARDKNVNITNVHQLENNIEAGAKYMRFIADKYFSDSSVSELDQILLVFASYNAGPNRVARVRERADNPNKWFDSVDLQVAQTAGSEPIKYVKNIYIYYTVFKKLEKELEK